MGGFLLCVYKTCFVAMSLSLTRMVHHHHHHTHGPLFIVFSFKRLPCNDFSFQITCAPPGLYFVFQFIYKFGYFSLYTVCFSYVENSRKSSVCMCVRKICWRNRKWSEMDARKLSTYVYPNPFYYPKMQCSNHDVEKNNIPLRIYTLPPSYPS